MEAIREGTLLFLARAHSGGIATDGYRKQGRARFRQARPFRPLKEGLSAQDTEITTHKTH